MQRQQPPLLLQWVLLLLLLRRQLQRQRQARPRLHWQRLPVRQAQRLRCWWQQRTQQRQTPLKLRCCHWQQQS